MNDQSINKYWEAETSLQEEQQLMREMMDTDSSESEYFRMIHAARQQKSRLTLEDIKAYNRQHAPASTAPKVLPLYRWVASAAAVMLFAVSALGLWNYSQQATQSAQMAETFEDPEQAYQELREALAYMSSKFNKTQDEALVNIRKASTYADMFK